MKKISPLLPICGLLFSTALFAQKWDTLAPIPESFTFPVVAEVGGKIHIMGGGGVGGATNHHFAYDPATDSWVSRAPVPYLAQQPAGAAADGKIHYFGGGYPTSGQPKADHHIYDPVTNSWTEAADLTALVPSITVSPSMTLCTASPDREWRIFARPTIRSPMPGRQKIIFLTMDFGTAPMWPRKDIFTASAVGAIPLPTSLPTVTISKPIPGQVCPCSRRPLMHCAGLPLAIKSTSLAATMISSSGMRFLFLIPIPRVIPLAYHFLWAGIITIWCRSIVAFMSLAATMPLMKL
ncbi:MAG: hypothetical protein IPH31_26460 [Lewinellaceae bacterium]|nr:hypothetical protein [Lewinellaceae bacterium]